MISSHDIPASIFGCASLIQPKAEPLTLIDTAKETVFRSRMKCNLNHHAGTRESQIIAVALSSDWLPTRRLRFWPWPFEGALGRSVSGSEASFSGKLRGRKRTGPNSGSSPKASLLLLRGRLTLV
jgi:hypothetical protein